MNVKSKQPRKKRKALANEALHERAHHVRGHLSKELRNQLKKRNIRLKKGDKVKILSGKFKGREGKISKISLFKRRIFIEGITRKTQRGKEIMVPIPPEKVLVLEMAERNSKKKETKTG